MYVINFSHPLTEDQKEQLNQHLGLKEDPDALNILDVRAQFDISQPFGPQVVALAGQVGLSPMEWQSERIVVLPPALAPAAILMLAELHGRMGYYPPCIRLTQRPGSTPPVFDVAELLDLNQQRQEARKRR